MFRVGHAAVLIPILSVACFAVVLYWVHLQLTSHGTSKHQRKGSTKAILPANRSTIYTYYCCELHFECIIANYGKMHFNVFLLRRRCV